jgi:hypothetical protein
MKMVHWRRMPIDWNNNWPASYGLRLDIIEAIEVFHDANEDHIVQISELGANLPTLLLPKEQVLVIVASYEQGRRMPQTCILTLTSERLLVYCAEWQSIALGDVGGVTVGPSSLLIRDSPIELRYGGMPHHFRLRGQDTARRFAECTTRAIDMGRG